MKKINIKHLTITVVGLIVLIGICVWTFSPKTKLELNGKETEVVSLHSIYQDQGVNLKDVKVEGKVDTEKEGTYKIVYTYKGQSVIRTVKVEDNRRIVMNLNGSQDTYVKNGEIYVESGCHAIDKKDGN